MAFEEILGTDYFNAAIDKINGNFEAVPAEIDRKIPGGATQQADGLMSKEDKEVLDALNSASFEIENHAEAGGAVVLQPGTNHAISISSDTTFVFGVPVNSGLCTIGLYLSISNSSTITWPDSMQWLGNQPEFQAGKSYGMRFSSWDGGTTWRLENNDASAFAAAEHSHAANDINAGTLGGKVQANAGTAASADAQVRNICMGTEDLSAGTSELATGTLYFVYE